jgi:F-type H+-transporting ATPase subunit b
MDNPLLAQSPGTIIWTLIIFGCLLILLKKLAWKPILDLLDKREVSIKESLDAASKGAEAATAELGKAREELASAR